jgi:hypothetical protein
MNKQTKFETIESLDHVIGGAPQGAGFQPGGIYNPTQVKTDPRQGPGFQPGGIYNPLPASKATPVASNPLTTPGGPWSSVSGPFLITP